MVGICIHNLEDLDGNQSSSGNNPFDDFSTMEGQKFSSIIKLYDPPYKTSTDVYDYIKNNIDAWVEEAIKIRKEN